MDEKHHHQNLDFSTQISFLIESFENLHLTTKSSDPKPPPPNVTEIEKIINYNFKNKELLKEAFTHTSYRAGDCQSYERLEYLGDSVLNHSVAMLHFMRYKEMGPGELTRLRAANVDTEALARASLKYGLHKFLRHRNPLLDKQIQEFVEGIADYPTHSHGMIDPPKVLADIFESLIGAIFVDTDASMNVTWEVAERLLQPLITKENLKLHPTARFNEACQKMGLKPQAKDFWNKTGEVEIYIDNKLVGRGKYKFKRTIAVNRAADDAYKNLFQQLGKVDGG